MLQSPGSPSALVVRLQPGTETLVAHLVSPVHLAPGAVATWWVHWPLEVLVARADGPVVDRWRAGLRQTLLGPVTDGEVLPACTARRAPGPQPYDRDRATVPLRLSARNDSPLPVELQRVPVDERGLVLVAAAGPEDDLLDLPASTPLALLGITVRLAAEDHAEASLVTTPVPEGFVPVPLPGVPAPDRPASSLSWLVGGTRRSLSLRL